MGRIASKSMSRAGCAIVLSAAASLGAAAHGQAIVLIDLSAETGIEFMHTPNVSMYPGNQDWMASGVVVADFNRDGWPDIFWASGGGTTAAPIPDKLFMNTGAGGFVERALEWGIAKVHAVCGACVGDYDGDGWPDMYLTSFGNGTNNQGQVGKNVLWRNLGGSFEDTALAAGVAFTAATTPSGYGCAFGDYDIDGDLDLMAAAWLWQAQANRLFRNNGDATFTDVTGVAVVFPTVLYGFQPAFADMDGDGWPELLVAADFKTSRYYRNNGDGTFTDVTVASGTGTDQNGMGQCVGDFDNDGRLDWYVTSIFLDRPNQFSGEGNKLYMNAGTHLYSETAASAGVADGGWGWGAAAVDLDNDGWLDIVTVNGRPGSVQHSNEQTYLFRNEGGGLFAEMALDCGLISSFEGKASCTVDYDRDGWMDLLIGNNGNFSGVSSPGAPSQLFRNATGDILPNAWLHLTFETTHNPRIAPMGFGARVTATIGSQSHVRFVDSGPNFLGTSEVCAHFGLGDATVVDELRIDWPRGYVTVMTAVAVNRHLVIHAPDLCDLDGDGTVGGADLGLLLGAWGPLGTTSVRKADFNDDGVVDGADLGVLLGNWSG